MDWTTQQNLCVGIGASAGGLREVLTICSRLPEEFAGIIILAMHRHPDEPGNQLKDLVEQFAHLKVVGIRDGSHLCCATIHVSRPCDMSEVVHGHFRTRADSCSSDRMTRIDEVFQSMACEFGRNSVGIILSGTLDDGVQGLVAIRRAGGRCIVQDPKLATFDEMPRNALHTVGADFIGSSDEIASELHRLSLGRVCVDQCQK